MITPSSNLCLPRLPRWAGLFLVALVLASAEAAAVHASGTIPGDSAPPPGPQQPAAAGVGPACPSSQPVVMAGAWRGFSHLLESTLNNRRRMIQFAVLGMCLALYIMIWRR